MINKIKYIKNILNKYKSTYYSVFFISLLLATLIFLSYGPTSKSFYQKIEWGDDLEQFTEAKILMKNPLQIFNINRYSAAAGTSTHYTPLLYVFWIPFLFFFNNNAIPYLIFGFVIHAINTILLFFIILRLSKNKFASLLGSTLFLLFPGNLITVEWISASFLYTTATLFMFLTLLSFIKYLDAKKRVYLFLSLIFYLFGCLTKQVFYPFFLILISYEVFIYNNDTLSVLKHNIKNVKELIKRHIPFILLSTIFVLIQLYRYKMGWIYQLKGGALFHPIIFYRLLDFLKEFLWPFNSNNYYLKFSLILLIFISFYYLFFYSKNKLFRFSIIWIFALGILPMTQFLRSIPESIRYIYVVSPGVFMLSSFLYVWKKWLVFIPLTLITIYFLILYNVI